MNKKQVGTKHRSIEIAIFLTNVKNNLVTVHTKFHLFISVPMEAIHKYETPFFSIISTIRCESKPVLGCWEAN